MHNSNSAYIKREWMIPISVNGTIVDVETTSISPKDGDVITCGFFSGNKISIFQRIDPSEEGKRKFFSVLYNWNKFYSRPFYAYNKKFEETWLRTNFDHDLMQKWKSEAEQKILENGKTLKWPRVSELISLPHNYYGLQDIGGKEVPEIWKNFCDSNTTTANINNERDVSLLDKIIMHNLNDLIREACLLMWDETSALVCANILFREIKKERKI